MPEAIQSERIGLPQEAALSKEEKSEKEKTLLLADVVSGRIDTLTKRVAFLLNMYPKTRDSDVVLQIQYWKIFEGHIFQGSVNEDVYPQLTKLTSIQRSRAKIQNDYHL